MSESVEAIVLCMKVGPSPFGDNVTGPCADCGEQIMWRPHAPNGVKICLPCCKARIDADGEPPEYVITQKTADELEALGYTIKPGPGQSVQ